MKTLVELANKHKGVFAARHTVALLLPHITHPHQLITMDPMRAEGFGNIALGRLMTLLAVEVTDLHTRIDSMRELLGVTRSDQLVAKLARSVEQLAAKPSETKT